MGTQTVKRQVNGVICCFGVITNTQFVSVFLIIPLVPLAVPGEMVNRRIPSPSLGLEIIKKPTRTRCTIKNHKIISIVVLIYPSFYCSPQSPPPPEKHETPKIYFNIDVLLKTLIMNTIKH